MSENTFLNAALAYLRRGWHPIPVEPMGKRPILPKWEEYMLRQPTVEEVTRWWTEEPNANVALVMGRGMVALDIDGPEGEAALRAAGITDLPVTATAQTGKGRHLLFLMAGNGAAPNRTGLLHKVDTRGDGGYVVAPPSVHESARQYEWVVGPDLIAPAPTELLALFARPGQGAKVEPSWVTAALAGVGEGERDVTCTRLAGYFWGKGLPAEVVETILLKAWAGDCTPPFPPDQVRKCVESIARREGGPDAPAAPPVDIGPLIDRTLGLIQNPPRAQKSGLAGLDDLMAGGFQPSELTYLGARPAVGKTALALQVARSVGAGGGRALVVTREMSPVALVRRMLAQESMVRPSSLRAGKLAPEEVLRLAAGAERLRRQRVWIADRAVTTGQISEMVERMYEDGIGLDIVIIDYLQLVRPPAEIRDRRAGIEYVSQQLKHLAKTFEVPVLCLSALSRPPRDAGPSWRPQLQDLRESGELEHDADNVLFLWWDYTSSTRELIVAKQRDGALGTLILQFDQYLRFVA